jgi:hypothetical protein
MKPARLVIVLVVGLVLVGGALLFMNARSSGRIDELQKRAETDAAYKRADVYFKGTEEEKKYLDGLFAYAKDSVREKLGGFLAPPPNEQKYFTALYQAMVDEARKASKEDFVKSFRGWIVGQGFVDVK